MMRTERLTGEHLDDDLILAGYEVADESGTITGVVAGVMAEFRQEDVRVTYLALAAEGATVPVEDIATIDHDARRVRVGATGGFVAETVRHWLDQVEDALYDLRGRGPADDEPAGDENGTEPDTRPEPSSAAGAGADAATTEEGGAPLSEAAVAAGTAVVGERPYEYTFEAPRETPDEGMLSIGTPVVLRDGQALGTIAEVAEDRFKVNVPLGPDIWLPRSALAGVAPGGDLLLDAQKDGLDDLTVPAPDADAEDQE